jgi:hypothetical protein
MNETAMGQLALMYRLVEEHLRREELSLHALRLKDDISKNERTAWQVRDLIRTLDKHDCLIKLGTGRGTTYKWNPEAKPFTLNLRAERLASTQPGPVSISKPIPKPKQMEIEFAGVVLTLGVNPETGLFRIIIDQKGK